MVKHQKKKKLNSSEKRMQMPSGETKQGKKSMSGLGFTELKIIATTPSIARANINQNYKFWKFM